MAAIPAPPLRGFGLGPFDVRIYGLLYVVAIAAAIWITARRWRRRGGSTELVWEVALWGVPAKSVKAEAAGTVARHSQIEGSFLEQFSWPLPIGVNIMQTHQPETSRNRGRGREQQM